MIFLLFFAALDFALNSHSLPHSALSLSKYWSQQWPSWRCWHVDDNDQCLCHSVLCLSLFLSLSFFLAFINVPLCCPPVSCRPVCDRLWLPRTWRLVATRPTSRSRRSMAHNRLKKAKKKDWHLSPPVGSIQKNEKFKKKRNGYWNLTFCFCARSFKENLWNETFGTRWRDKHYEGFGHHDIEKLTRKITRAITFV